ncbi:MAG: class I SAM-dependent methyltransferase [Candidatus Sericytochromatia bacterium]|nr:class I SAM-dependent methyltransferase [Candidatus Sericytochromatia bacterium]
MADLFQDKAQNWDAQERVRSLSNGIGTALLNRIAFSESMQVMDFGAGTGLLSGHVAPYVAQVFAVDTSPAMLAQLKAKPGLQGKVETLCQNILETPLNQTFDVIVSAMALHHVEDTSHLFQQFAQHLKPGGQLALADLESEDGNFHPPEAEGVFHAGFDPQLIQSLLKQNGFEQIVFETVHTVFKSGVAYPIFLVSAQLPKP